MPDAEPNLRLVPLCRAELDLGELRHLDTADGRRLVGEIIRSRWAGPRLAASQVGSGSDWLTYCADSMAVVDVRLQLVTDDGASLLVRYSGRSDITAGHIVTSVQFETGAPAYRWLNRIMAVGFGRHERGSNQVVYDISTLEPA